jgi:hypothetical protein
MSPDGRSGFVLLSILLALPFICTADDVERIVGRLGDAVDAALAACGVAAPA